MCVKESAWRIEINFNPSRADVVDVCGQNSNYFLPHSSAQETGLPAPAVTGAVLCNKQLQNFNERHQGKFIGCWRDWHIGRQRRNKRRDRNKSERMWERRREITYRRNNAGKR